MSDYEHVVARVAKVSEQMAGLTVGDEVRLLTYCICAVAYDADFPNDGGARLIARIADGLSDQYAESKVLLARLVKEGETPAAETSNGSCHDFHSDERK
jgi:hypothetical protein